MPELVGGCTCTGTTGAELRRPASDGAADAIDMGVPESIENVRWLLGQMLAGVMRLVGVGAATGVQSKLPRRRGSRLSGGFGHTVRRQPVEALHGVATWNPREDVGESEGKPPHDAGTWRAAPRCGIAPPGSLGAAAFS